MAFRVRSYVKLNARVCKQNIEVSTPGSQAPLEEKEEQMVFKHECRPNYIDYNDWRWRWETAIAILCSGYADTTGYYTGDVLGGKFV